MDSLIDKVVEKHKGRLTGFLESSFDVAAQKFSTCLLDRLSLLIDALMLMCKFILGLLVAQTVALMATCYILVNK